MIDPNVRRNGLGGSEIAALWGLHPYLTPYTLQLRKKHPEAFEYPENDSQAIGHILEKACLDVYAHLTKRRVRYLNETRQHPTLPIVYSPDGMCEEEACGVELKVYADEGRRYFGPYQNELPDFMKVQCHVYMAMMDIPTWDVFVLLAGRPQIFTVHQDRELEAAIIDKGCEFWSRYIVGDEELPIDDPEAATRYLQWRYPTHRRPDLRIASVKEAALLDEYAQVRRELGPLTSRRKLLEAGITSAIKDSEGLVWEGGKFTWRRTKDSTVTDWKSMALGLRNEQTKDPEKRAEILNFYTRPKPGERRIYFKAANFEEGEDVDE